jgi:hypothetical protein
MQLQKKTVAFPTFLLAIIMFAGSVSAIGIAPSLVRIDYEPGFNDTYRYYVRAGPHDSLVNITSRVNIKCDLRKFIKPSITEASLRKNEIRYFNVDVQLPEEPPRPGLHECGVVAEEMASGAGGGGVSAYAAVMGLIYIYVPYPDKYIEARLGAPNVNLGDPVEFTLSLVSRGLKNVTASSVIKVTDSEGKNLATLYTDEMFVESRKSASTKATWDTTGFPAGRYSAEATVEYGGESPVIAGTQFKIGEMLIKVTNLTYPEHIYTNDIVKIELELDSYWNSKITGAYIALEVYDTEGIRMGNPKSETFDIDAWDKKTIPVFWDTSGLEEGTYELRFTVNYEGRTTEKSISLEIETVPDYSMIILLLAAVAILFVAIIYYLLRRKGEGSPGEMKK